MDLPVDLTPLEGGFSGETFVAGDGGARVVVRIYGGRSLSRGPSAVEVDASVLRWMRGIVPVARVLEVRRPAGELPGLLLTEWLPGVRVDLVLPTLDPHSRRTVGTNLGRILDRLAHVPTLVSGRFTDSDLLIAHWGSGDGLQDGLIGWVENHAPLLTTWTVEELAGLARITEDAQSLVDTVERTCLVHGDFNAKNVLIDPDTLAVTGVLDWEFAHSGSPYADLGNLLRFEDDEEFVSGVLEGLDAWNARRRTLELARAADLFALVDLVARDHDDAARNPVTDAAHALLRASVAAEESIHRSGHRGVAPIQVPGASPG